MTVVIAVAVLGQSVAGASTGARAGLHLAQTASGRCGASRYRVGPGDTLWSIAHRFKVGVRELAAANALDLDGVLLAGLDLTVPGTCRASSTRGARPSARAQSLTRALAEVVATTTVPGARTSLVVVDLKSDAIVYQVNPGTPLEPASTEKLPLATAALQRLGGGFRTTTDVLGDGRLIGSTWRGDLVLKGHGDPALTTAGLNALAQAVRRRGITSVTGRIVGDESYFDDARTAPGWKPEFAKNESPLLSALVVDRGILDGTAVDHPALAAAILFARSLRAEGIAVGHAPAVGRASAEAILLTRRASPPLITLLGQMDAWSDNFIAEILFKQLGARIAGRGTTAAGATVVASTLAQNEIPLTGVRLADGSGLSRFDRLTARTLAATLETIAHTAALRHLLTTFAVAGSTGTLRHRLLGLPGHQLVRGKTGTTDHSSALVGFVGSRYAFAVLSNGNPVDWVSAHLLQDRVAKVLIASAE
ncbi:MAG TPA: D-alanyl-D-alanine carboxypeptidase/D-alanyl-D-alanine-endopeptidase [Gaiellaceae bacterium]|jgi:D-alanyl-D-alanine carboxypeptidase/D-alanyl-D-alanine-endopeptidase (penicillin-binding protein 4)